MLEYNRERRDWQDVVWERVDYVDTVASLYQRIKGSEEFSSVPDVNNFVRLLQEQMAGKLVIENGLVMPNLPRGKLWHVTNADRLPSILEKGLEPQAEDQYEPAGLKPVNLESTDLMHEGEYTSLPCLFFAMHPNYAVFKKGRRGTSEEILTLLEIDWPVLKSRGYKLFPVYPSDGYPINRLSPIPDLENALEKGIHGNLEFGCYETLQPDPLVITGIFVDRRATRTQYPRFRVVEVDTTKGLSADASGKGWNRAVVEYYSK